MDAAITLTEVGKRYRLGTRQGSLRDLVDGLGRTVFRRPTNEPAGQHVWALRNLSLDVPTGGVLGVIGSNGAGKTTLLKLLSRVTKPTVGSIDVMGRMSSLIELGAGFHPDLTGRENVFLNGSILGMPRRELQARYDEIVAFAELERFIDTPVKRYSSGMYARLGFSVAAHVDPDILVVDEVLAVGDGPFQRKCYDFMRDFIKRNRTVVFVSHNMAVIEQLCSQVLWIDHGMMKLVGSPESVLPAYFDAMDHAMAQPDQGAMVPSEQMNIDEVRVTDGSGVERESFHTGDEIVVTLAYHTLNPIRKPHFCIGLTGPEGGPLLILASMLVDGKTPDVISGPGVMSCRFQSIPLQPRAYQIFGEVWDGDQVVPLVPWQRFGTFRISMSDEQRMAVRKGGVRHLRADAPIHVAYDWVSGETA